MRRCLVWIGLVLVIAAPAEAKKVRYASGPKAPADTTLSVAVPEYEPIVRSRGPKVAYTNLQIINTVAVVGIQRALASAPLDSGGHVVIAPAESHPLNFVIEHAILRALSRRGITATVRRTILADDSLMSAGNSIADPVLAYQLDSARITSLRLRARLTEREQIQRRGLVA
jgi:hypothetical protein